MQDIYMLNLLTGNPFGEWLDMFPSFFTFNGDKRFGKASGLEKPYMRTWLIDWCKGIQKIHTIFGWLQFALFVWGETMIHLRQWQISHRFYA